MRRRRICVVTGSRAEYGLLRWLLLELQEDPAVTLQVAVTGAHLSPVHGLTVDAVEADGFEVAARVEMQLASDTGVGTAKSLGLGVIGFADAFDRLRPDLVVVLGDRFEVLAAASAAMAQRLPIAHVHGGEATEGLWDEAVRHAVTKMAHLHFVAAEPYRRRVIQLGEQPERVHLVGAPGLDALERLDLLDPAEVQDALGWTQKAPAVLLAWHPVTLSRRDPAEPVLEICAALERLPGVRVVATRPNADAGGHRCAAALEAWARERPEWVRLVDDLGQLGWLSALKCADVLVGNSSSGLIEAPAVGTPTVNVGERQRGRLRAASVIDCAEERDAVAMALQRALSPSFRAGLPEMPPPPYGGPGASRRIAEVLRGCELESLLMKAFHDVDVDACVPC